ncbi:MAG: single-stranded DNA-binding protein [Lentimicrobiaceae bacterium]|jgi:single-strand DNA-binding protein|nr:single-stranded DNA-binding protein [Lentimicrobiaceae bacterium]
MSTMRNSVQLIGRPGNDPEVKTFENDRTVARFTLATNDYYYNQKGERIDDTQWHNIVAWGKIAETVQKLVKKGKLIAIEGKLTNRTWEDKDKKSHQITEIILNEIITLEKDKGIL